MSNELDRLGARAQTLGERLARAHQQSAEERAATTLPKDLELFRDFWATSLGNHDALRQRLAWDGLDASSVPTILSDEIHHDENPGSLEWLSFLREALRVFAADCGDSSDQSNICFIELWSAFGAVAVARLRSQPKFGKSAQDSPALSDEAWREIGEFLSRRLAPAGTAVLFNDFASYRQSHDPDAQNPETYGDWMRQLRAGGAGALLCRFPVLARALSTMCLDAVAALSEWWERFSADWPELRRVFSLPSAIKQVKSLKLGMSDRHYHGRQAMALTLTGGSRLIYKPKSIDLDAALGTLLQVLAHQAGDAAVFPVPVKTLARPGYGWAEFVEHHAFTSRTDVERYYRQCGALLAVVYSLEGRDFTMDNLVTTKHGPAAIDAETLLQPLCRPGGADDIQGEALAKLTDRILCERDFSVLDTGMLPAWQASADPSAGFFDVSGIGGQTGYKAGVSAEQWIDIGTTRMRAERRPVDVPPELNVVTLDGQPCSAKEFTGQIAHGFTEAYQLLVRLRDDPKGELLSMLHSWKDAQVRFLLRATGIYGRTLQQMLQPMHLLHPVLQGAVAERLWKPFLREGPPPVITPFLREEGASLAHFDIPCFHLAAHGDARPQFLVSPLEMGLHRLKGMSEADMDAQLRVVRASFTLTPRKQPTTLDREVALDEAKMIADMLEMFGDAADHIHSPSVAGFGTESSAAGSSHAKAFLYDGPLAGRALFYSALAKISGDGRYRERALATLEELWNISGDNAEFRATAGSLPVGAATGAPSVSATFLMAARILGVESLRDRAADLAKLVTRNAIASDAHFDVLCGAAGAAMFFAGAAVETDPDGFYRERALWCGEHLLANARKLEGHHGLWWRGEIGECYLGYGHGAAGIAAALARLFVLTQEERFRAASQEVFNALDHLFNESKGRWPVLVREGGEQVYQTMEALCHGSAGMALGAVDALRSGLDSRQVATRALQVLAQAQLSPVDTLCCGNMGRVEALLAIKSEGAPSPAAQVAAKVLERREPCGLFRTSLKRSEHWTLPPSFFRGLSGMGYSVLRAAWPSELPSLATWR